MNKLANVARRFSEEESGAAMVEYTVLIGIITVAAILAIAGIGIWVKNSFTALCTDVNANSGTACAPAAAPAA